MSRPVLLSTLPLAAFLATGCLDSDTPHMMDGGDMPWAAVAEVSPEPSALPPKPALAQLTSATDASTRQRFMDAALGADVSAVFGTAVGFALAPPPTCPTVDRRGGTIYSTPSCTDDAGVSWSGRLVAHTWDDTRPMTISLERWRADGPGARDDVGYDGTVTVHRDGRFEANLVAARDGLVTRTFARWQVVDGEVVADVDSWVVVEHHGIAQIGGAWNLPRNQRPTGLLVLTGAQEMAVDFDAADPACAPIYADGEIYSKRCDLGSLADDLAAFQLF